MVDQDVETKDLVANSVFDLIRLKSLDQMADVGSTEAEGLEDDVMDFFFDVVVSAIPVVKFYSFQYNLH